MGLRNILLLPALFFGLVSLSVHSDPIKNTNIDGECDQGYVLIVDVCLASSAFENYSQDELMQLIIQFKEGSGMEPPRRIVRKNTQVCKSKISDRDGDYFELRDGSILRKKGYGYIGYIGYAKDSLLIMGSRSRGKLVIEGKEPFDVELLRAPRRCSKPSVYSIGNAYNDEKFIINGEVFEAKTYCMGWDSGDRVIFLDGSAYGACASAELYNIDRNNECSVWCE
ncbi:MAG: hypothetical protein R3217_01175 [Gammaproteobacteria bacterium]|nr:hypothetical protein [Gammaproteobacteria bacterium]